MTQPELANSMDGTSAVDFMALLGRCLGNFKVVERAITTFRDAGWADLNELQAATERRDYAKVVEVAHRFKGAASNVSASGLSKILLQAEQAGHEKEHEKLMRIVEELRQAWDGFQRVVQALAPSDGTSKHGSFEVPKSNLGASHARASC